MDVGFSIEGLEESLNEWGQDLAEMLTASSGLPFVYDGRSVSPAESVVVRARMKELGSSSMGIAPEPYVRETLRKWQLKWGFAELPIRIVL